MKNAAALLAVILFAAFLRLPYLHKSATSDEIALIDPRGAHAIITDYETRSNPPLQRLLINLPFRDGNDAWRAGQALSLVATLAAIVFAFLLGLRISEQSWPAAFVAALIIAADPVFLGESTRFRSYAPWLAIAMWQWYALARDARVEFAIATALLPWIHYTSVVLIAAEAIALLVVTRKWRTIVLFIPAALAALPLAWIYRIALASQPPPAQGNFVVRLLTLGAGGIVSSLSETRAGLGQLPGVIATILVVAIIFFAAQPFARIAGITYALALPGFALVGQYRLVRAPAALWLLPMLVVIVISLPLVIRQPQIRFAACAYIALVMTVNAVSVETRPEMGDAITSVADRWPQVLARARGRGLRVVPDYAAHLLLFAVYGKTTHDLPHGEGCPDGALCWNDRGVRLMGGGEPVDGEVVLRFREPQAPWPLTPCARKPLHAYALLTDCGTSISAGLPRSGEAERSASVHPQ